MNQQDVLKRVSLGDVVKSFNGNLKSAFVLIGMLAALLVIMITAVSIQQSTQSPAAAVSVAAADTRNMLAVNPELKVQELPTLAAIRSELAINPELKALTSFDTVERDVLATNPELKAFTLAGATSEFLTTNPEIGTFLRHQD